MCGVLSKFKLESSNVRAMSDVLRKFIPFETFSFVGAVTLLFNKISKLFTMCKSLSPLVLATFLSVSLVACDGNKGSQAPTLDAETVTRISRQATGFIAAKDRLPELADLVNNRDWTFTRNLIHGPMQEVGREMLYINRLLLPSDRDEAERLAKQLKTAMAQLDEAALDQNAERLRRSYLRVEEGFGAYAEIIPPEAMALESSSSNQLSVAEVEVDTSSDEDENTTTTDQEVF